MNTIFEDEIKFLSNSLRSLDYGAFRKLLDDCAETISQKRGKLIATGLGKNVPVCEKFVGTMTSLGLPASFMHTNSAIHGDLGLVNKDDLVIILTKSGSTIESVALAKLLFERECRIWLLSFSKNSVLVDIIPNQIILKLEHEGDLWNIVPNNSTIINLIVLQKLCICLAKKLNIGIEEFRKNHPGGHIGELLKCAK